MWGLVPHLEFKIKYLIYMFNFYLRYCDFIDPTAAGDDPGGLPRNTDALILCISNTGIFLLQSAIDIFVVIILSYYGTVVNPNPCRKVRYLLVVLAMKLCF